MFINNSWRTYYNAVSGEPASKLSSSGSTISAPPVWGLLYKQVVSFWSMNRQFIIEALFQSPSHSELWEVKRSNRCSLFLTWFRNANISKILMVTTCAISRTHQACSALRLLHLAVSSAQSTASRYLFGSLLYLSQACTEMLPSQWDSPLPLQDHNFSILYSPAVLISFP